MKNKVALITGGTRGIGLGIAQALAKNGYDIAVNGQRSATLVESVIKELKSYGNDAIYCQGNIADAKERKQILTDIKDHYGSLNILINNAGVAPKQRKDLLEIEESSYDWLLDINLKGPFFLSQETAKWMIEQKEKDQEFEASIVNLTSMSANTASINRGEYCVSKAGMSMMSQLFAVKLSEYNIPVFEVRPGIISTDMTAKVSKKYEKMMSDGLALEKRMGSTEDVASVVKVLVEGEIPYSTGQIFTVDGGINIRRL